MKKVMMRLNYKHFMLPQTFVLVLHDFWCTHDIFLECELWCGLVKPKNMDWGALGEVWHNIHEYECPPSTLRIFFECITYDEMCKNNTWHTRMWNSWPSNHHPTSFWWSHDVIHPLTLLLGYHLETLPNSNLPNLNLHVGEMGRRGVGGVEEMPNGGRQNEKRKQQTGRKRIKQRKPDWFWCIYRRWQVYMKVSTHRWWSFFEDIVSLLPASTRCCCKPQLFDSHY